MWLSRLSLAGTRNLRDQALEFPPEGAAILGRNAQGKTNLLEAIQYLETFRSFRGARDAQLVRHGGDVFRIASELRPSASDRGGASPTTVTAAYEASSGTKRITVDGEVPSRTADAIGRPGAVLFTPDDVRLVTDGPSERRRFLDIVLSLGDPRYLDALQRYRQALLRRNAALRRGEGGAVVGAWDGILVAAGSRIVVERARWIRVNNPGFGAVCAEVSGGEGARMIHEPGIPGLPRGGEGEDEEAVRRAFGRALAASAVQEGRRRATLVGPHRDDLSFPIGTREGERDARSFGSGGQRRTVALALRLVEADTVRERRGREPILLLDDVFAELDEDRSARLLRLLDRELPGQVFLTAPKEGDVRLRGDRLQRYRVEGGDVRPSVSGGSS